MPRELELYEAVLAGQPWAICLLLKNKGKDRGYTERQEHTGDAGQTVTIRVVSEDATADIATRLPHPEGG